MGIYESVVRMIQHGDVYLFRFYPEKVGIIHYPVTIEEQMREFLSFPSWKRS